MKICILTQTATDISNYYKEFFKDHDLYFVTFKSKNREAIDFLPKSTWSAGRNRLWEQVRGKYDYYMFIDDDLEFFKTRVNFSPFIQYHLEDHLFKNPSILYSKCTSKAFFSRLESHLNKYKPQVLSVRNLNNQSNKQLDHFALVNKTFARRLGWFDAQFTIFSQYAADRLLPYDTLISGWASAQILIYLLSHHVFASEAINVLDIGVNNAFHTGAYVTDYKSNQDCKKMISEICKVTNNEFEDLYDPSTNHVNLFYGKDKILNPALLPSHSFQEDFHLNFKQKLAGLEALMINNNLTF